MSDSPIRLLVHGARGRMGTQVAALARNDARFQVVAEVDVADWPAAGLNRGALDAIIDFSSDDGTRAAAELATRIGAALLVGTTALSAATEAALGDAARTVPVLVAANTSLGVAVLTHLAAEAALLLGPEYVIELTETHHTGKKDAPSGTALRLAAALRERADVELPVERVRSIRTGNVIGEHVIEFIGPGERVRIMHSATSRDLFARGALRAAAWLVRQPPGRYCIEQALALD